MLPQKNLESSERPFAFGVIDAQAIPHDDASFDAVIANHMLYHVPDRTKALAEMRRVLRPNGKFYASTASENHMRELDEMISQFDAKGDYLFAESNPFTLESGVEQLAACFTNVTLHRYEDDLIVTEAAPLITYAMSMIRTQSVFTDDGLAKFTAYVEQELATHSAIHITKDSGMFGARKQSSAE